MKDGDFDMKSKRTSSEITQYFQHGLPFMIMTTIIVLLMQLVATTFSSLISLFVNSTFYASDILSSPFASSIIAAILILFGIIAVVLFYGFLNIHLTERIWEETQNKLWDRYIGLGFILMATLFIVHMPLFPFLFLWDSGLLVEQIIFVAIYIPSVSIFDGVIAKTLGILRFD